MAPPGLEVVIYDGVGGLPHFNPDDDVESLPPPVVAWREAVTAADGMLVSCPEYARGIPGSFKNALDWLVSDTGRKKPVAIWNAAPRAVATQEALRLVLATLSSGLVEAACVTLPASGVSWTADALLADDAVRATLEGALAAFVAALERED
ncbi:NAD(P)H-dependent FMN reductase [Alphaproteobacteria bacterium SO-S41]|nr:NAD(P)H-dependent FMN reductase [Alphaproteobacteria bacterium SO-S41]